MKKSILAVITVLMLLLVACQMFTENKGDNTTGTSQTTMIEGENPTGRTDEHGSTALTKTGETNSTSTTSILPTYVSGNIELQEEWYIKTLMDVSYPLHYRAIYYELDSTVGNMVDEKERGIWYSEYQKAYGEKEATEMLYVSFIKHFNIPQADFEKFVEDREALYLAHGTDVSDEMYEIPNPDIIYTFDNAIINEYYRRE